MLLTLLLIVLAPLSVVLTLSDVRHTFLAYHLLICLLLPLVHSLATGRGLRGHLRLVGLAAPSRESLREGLATGLLLGGGTVAFFAWAGASMLSPTGAAAALSEWGVVPGERTLLIAFMLLVNGPAEELFWRGWIHGRLADVHPRGLALGAAALAYASYHFVTLEALLPTTGAALLGFAAVVLAGLWWSWRREKRGDVWGPLLGHAGATAGYMVVYVLHVA